MTRGMPCTCSLGDVHFTLTFLIIIFGNNCGDEGRSKELTTPSKVIEAIFISILHLN